MIGRRSRKHGHAGYADSRTYRSWCHAKARCYNPTDRKYADYGGRGIRMSEEWRDDFGAFLRDMGEASPGLTLDRIDNDGNYERGNCRWATHFQQLNNRRVTYNPMPKSLKRRATRHAHARRRMLAGAIVLARVKERRLSEAEFLSWIDEAVRSPEDRALFGL